MVTITYYRLTNFVSIKYPKVTKMKQNIPEIPKNPKKYFKNMEKIIRTITKEVVIDKN